jgi:hypothetical protein
VSRWEDLVKASRFMGRPILRLDDGSRSFDQPLFYIPDGPQSYVYDFQQEGVNPANSAGYALARTSGAATVSESPTSPIPESLEPVEPSPAEEPPVPEAPHRPESATFPVSGAKVDSRDRAVEQYLGPDIPESIAPTESAEKNGVELEIRKMIRDVVRGLQKLPPSSERLEEGTYHVQRAVELLQAGRYGSAQIEVNRAVRIVADAPRASRNLSSDTG